MAKDKEIDQAVLLVETSKMNLDILLNAYNQLRAGYLAVLQENQALKKQLGPLTTEDKTAADSEPVVESELTVVAD